MSIPKLLKHYQINPSKLKAILKANSINDNIRFINNIPEEWISILSEETGIEVYEISTNKHYRSSVVKASKKITKKDNSLDKLQELSKPKRRRKSFQIGYVKYVAPDNSHAYLKVIDNIDGVNYNMLRENTDNDCKINNNCADIEIGQFVIVSVKGEKFKKHKIEEQLFSGTVITKPIKRFTDWVSFNNVIKLENNIMFSDNFENFEISKVKLFFDRRSIRCQKSEIPPDFNKIIDNIKLPFIEAIAKKILSNEDLVIIGSFKSNSSEYSQLYEKQFKSEINDSNYFKDEIDFENFFLKWQALCPEFLVISKVKNLEFLNSYIRLWLDKKTNKNFWENHLIDALINYEIKSNENLASNQLTFYENLTRSHVEEISLAIDAYFQANLVTESIKVFNILEQLIVISNCLNKAKYKTQLKNSLVPELAFELWLEDNQLEFPKTIGITTFQDHKIEIQERILDKLSDEEIVPLISLIKGISNKILEKRVCKLIKESISSKLNFISFDLESNGTEIFELGWINNENREKYYKGNTEVNKGINFFKELTEISNSVFVGHNIVEWDIPILSKFKVSIPRNQIWDTLLIETFLSPEFKNLALVTAHNAIDDSKLTRQLFLNQLTRILFMEQEKLTPLFSYIPINIVEKIVELKSKNSLNWNPFDVLNSEKETFFRPQPLENILIQKVKKEIDDLKSENILIIGNDSFKNEILTIEKIKFHCTDTSNKDLYKLNRTKINQISENHIWEKLVLLNHLDYKKAINQPAFWGELPISVKIKLENNISNVFDLFYPNEEIDWLAKNVMFFTIPELLLYQDQLSQLKDISVITIQKDLLSVENKKKLKEISLDFLMSEIKNDDHIWLKFSGGQSFSELTVKQCENLEVDILKPFDNFWLEKVTLNKFNVWGNFNWENLLLSFDIINLVDFQSDANKFVKNQTIIVEVSAVETLKNKVVRFNPESLYRSRYWVFQKQLIDQIVNLGNASILIVQDYDEIQVLNNYFSHLGYYIPEQVISIGRRLELLHQRKSSAKLIIEHISQVERIIKSNHVDCLNIIFDSFNLSENYYSSINSSYLKKLNSSRLKKINEIEEDDSEKGNNDKQELNISKKPIISDTFFLLELLKPRITHIRNVLQKADPNHKLWILDPRFNDYNSINKSWNTSKMTLNIWKNFDMYEAAVKEADMHINSVKPMEELPFDMAKIKEILRQVFLKEFQWRPSQVPYLELIIERKENQLITLPTGEGKSVLFQGPALFISAFTNRLTIVVTPLKALMEDQVDALWNKGFFGSVDYINSDRSSEVYSIYRAMAGGELSLIFVTPERFRSRSFNNALQMRIQSDGGLEYGVFDEAHCVSQWGHEFRPDYFNCAKEMLKLKKMSSNNFPLLLFSATVSDKIYKDFKIIFS
ncbi:DEAD/DEAH box helicase [Polaribacter litorisediminis]|uniref:DEAD/DEAH box helicase n=1 Tax=Polaribacter litorisediminis TaxID=1908341 RepID=UPI001CC09753|nr:DEAD/DEAH box helicase [Polaribacter litorisediminis]UAM98015.1 DEAD/DEAH box helicase [Polaribacter litorisediminis]